MNSSNTTLVLKFSLDLSTEEDRFISAMLGEPVDPGLSAERPQQIARSHPPDASLVHASDGLYLHIHNFSALYTQLAHLKTATLHLYDWIIEQLRAHHQALALVLSQLQVINSPVSTIDASSVKPPLTGEQVATLAKVNKVAVLTAKQQPLTSSHRPESPRNEHIPETSISFHLNTEHLTRLQTAHNDLSRLKNGPALHYRPSFGIMTAIFDDPEHLRRCLSQLPRATQGIIKQALSDQMQILSQHFPDLYARALHDNFLAGQKFATNQLTPVIEKLTREKQNTPSDSHLNQTPQSGSLTATALPGIIIPLEVQTKLQSLTTLIRDRIIKMYGNVVPAHNVFYVSLMYNEVMELFAIGGAVTQALTDCHSQFTLAEKHHQLARSYLVTESEVPYIHRASDKANESMQQLKKVLDELQDISPTTPYVWMNPTLDRTLTLYTRFRLPPISSIPTLPKNKDEELSRNFFRSLTFIDGVESFTATPYTLTLTYGQLFNHESIQKSVTQLVEKLREEMEKTEKSL